MFFTSQINIYIVKYLCTIFMIILIYYFTFGQCIFSIQLITTHILKLIMLSKVL